MCFNMQLLYTLPTVPSSNCIVINCRDICFTDVSFDDQYFTLSCCLDQSYNDNNQS